MGWTFCIIWFLYVCDRGVLPDSDPPIYGEVQSPQYPQPYPSNLQEQWDLSVPEGYQIQLTFTHMDIEASPECHYDSLTVLYHKNILGKFCGHKNSTDGHHPGNQTILSPGNRLMLIFQTDNSNPDHHQPVGFTAHYQAIAVDCGFPDISEDGILQVVGSDNPRNKYKDQIQFNCSSKYYTLEGNDTYTCSASGEWVSDGGETNLPKCTPVCGTPETDLGITGRILGGRDASLGEIPWHLLIREPSRGGASLINDQWAVTAAHVVENVEQTSLRLYGGLVNGKSIADNLPHVVDMESEKIIIHPGYNKDLPYDQRTDFDNDIALIKLNSRVNFNSNLLPICLPEANRGLVENEQGTVSGWGLTEAQRNKAILVTSRKLKYANIGVYSLKQCQNTPRTHDNRPMIFTDNMFCAGAQGRDSCQKDNGGPFVSPMLSLGGGPYYLTGIVSWGPPCEQRMYKGYYTKVENYVDWIKETIDKEES